MCTSLECIFRTLTRKSCKRKSRKTLSTPHACGVIRPIVYISSLDVTRQTPSACSSSEFHSWHLKDLMSKFRLWVRQGNQTQKNDHWHNSRKTLFIFQSRSMFCIFFVVCSSKSLNLPISRDVVKSKDHKYDRWCKVLSLSLALIFLSFFVLIPDMIWVFLIWSEMKWEWFVFPCVCQIWSECSVWRVIGVVGWRMRSWGRCSAQMLQTRLFFSRMTQMEMRCIH